MSEVLSHDICDSIKSTIEVILGFVKQTPTRMILKLNLF